MVPQPGESSAARGAASSTHPTAMGSVQALRDELNPHLDAIGAGAPSFLPAALLEDLIELLYRARDGRP